MALSDPLTILGFVHMSAEPGPPCPCFFDSFNGALGCYHDEGGGRIFRLSWDSHLKSLSFKKARLPLYVDVDDSEDLYFD